MSASRPAAGPCAALALAAALALGGGPARSAAALTLAEGLAIVSASGRETAVAEAAVDLARTAPALAAAARRPSVDLYARETLLAYRPESDPGLGQTIPLGERDSLAWGVRVRQTLWDFGAADAAVAAASAEADAAALDAALERNRTGLRFILAYLRVLRSEGLLAVARDEVTRFEAHREDTRALLEEGTITGNDLLQAEVRLADAVQRRLQAENAAALAAAQVNSLLVRPLDEPVGALEPPPRAGGAGLEEALAASGESRPELRRIRARLAAAEARRAGTRADSLPRFSLGGAYEFAQNEFQVHEGNWALVAGVDVNLYSGGAARARAAQREREIALLARSLEQARDAVALEVRAAALDLGSARARVAATAAAVAQARENLRLERLRYAEGVGTSTDVLDAVALAAAAEQNEINVRHDVTEAEARLDFAAGRDLVGRWGGAPAAAEGDDRHE